MMIQNKTILQKIASMQHAGFNKISLRNCLDSFNLLPIHLVDSIAVVRQKAIALAEQFNLDYKVRRYFIYNTTIMT